MRITNNMLINNMMNNIGNNLGRMDKYQNQLASGKKIQVPSDDPVVAARALKLRTDVSEVSQYQTNVKDAQSWLDITETSLGNIGDVLQRARELAVQGSNASLTTGDMQKIATEVTQLRGQVIQQGNSTYAGRYIFSGYKTDTKFIDGTTGNFAITVNNSESIKYEIGIGDDIDINVAGGDLFNGGGNAIGDSSGVATGNVAIASLTIAAGVNDTLGISIDGGALIPVTIPAGIYTDNNALASAVQTAANAVLTPPTSVNVQNVGNKLQFTSGSQGNTSSVVIDTMSNAAANLGLATTTQVSGTTGQKGKLIQDFDNFITALNNGDQATVAGMITSIDANMDNVLRIRADVGARQNRLDLTSNRLDSDNVNFTKLMSENEDVDMAETIMNLQNEENVYRASLAGGAKIIQPSLVDFLR